MEKEGDGGYNWREHCGCPLWDITAASVQPPTVDVGAVKKGKSAVIAGVASRLSGILRIDARERPQKPL